MNQLKILTVDDDPFTLKLLKKKLEKEGFAIESANDGIEACEFISKTFYDIILTDLAMPGGVDGMDVLSAAKAKSKQTEVILLTAHVSVQSAVEAMKNGAFDYLQKPINFYELMLRIEKIKSFKQLVKNAQDLREAMDVTETNAAQTIQHLEMTVAGLENTIFEIKKVIMNKKIDQGARIERVISMIS
jgi:two-component system OmpR family response regulator